MTIDNAGEIEQGLSEQDKADELAAFNAEVGPDDGKALHGEPVITGEPEPKPKAIPKQESKPAPAKAAAEPDPWEGVNPKLKEVFESQAGTIKQLGDTLKMTQGRVGALQSALDTAKSVSKAAGGGFTINADAMKAFREEFGDDLANHMSKIFVATAEAKAAATEQGKAFDADAFFRERVQPTFSTAIADAKTEARELAKLDAKYDGWEDTIQTPDFQAWAFEGGPTQEERDQAAAVTDPAKAEAAQNALIRKYPIWWSEKGALMESPKSADAAKLLDNYTGHVTAQSKSKTTTQDKRNRLVAAVTPKGTQQPAREAVSDDEAAQAAFEAQFDT